MQQLTLLGDAMMGNGQAMMDRASGMMGERLEPGPPAPQRTHRTRRRPAAWSLAQPGSLPVASFIVHGMSHALAAARLSAEHALVSSRLPASTHTIADSESAWACWRLPADSVWRGVVGCGCEFG